MKPGRIIRRDGEGLEKPTSTRVLRGARQTRPTIVQPHQKLPRVHLADYLAFVHEIGRERGCLNPRCRQPIHEGNPIEAAHVDFDGSRGKGSKAPDIWAIPVCRFCHQGAAGIERIGWRAWAKHAGLDLPVTALKLNAMYWRTRA